MANENQQQKNLQEVAESLKSAQQNLGAGQTAINQSYKESVNLLTKMNNLITDSASKTSSFEKSTINIKRIQAEAERIERRRKNIADQISQANQIDVTIAEDYISNIEKRRKLEEDIVRKRSVGNFQQANQLTQQLNLLEQQIVAQESSLQQEQISLIAKIQSQSALKERVDLIGKELEVEKNIKEELGLTGTALKLLNKYLLFGKDLYGKMVEEAREGDKTTKKWVASVALLSAGVYAAYKGISAFLSAAKEGLDSLTGTGGPISKFFSPFTNLVKQIPFIGGFLGGLAEAFFNLMDFATDTAAKVENFARNLGISYQEAKKINLEFASFAVNSGKAFLTVEKLQNSQIELSKALGVNAILNNQILSDNIQLQEQVGLELETRKQLAEVTLISGKYQTQIFKTIVGQVEALRRTVGINLRAQDVIANISKLTGVVGLTFAKYPEKLAKSLAITKALGIDFQKLDSVASGLLDFESSIASEFEAQLLANKDINLQKARQLAMDNDLTGLAVELNKQLGSSEDFLKMNRFSQESIAAALKMSRDELADMLRQQEMFAAAGATDLKTFKERIAQMEKADSLQSEFLDKLSEEQAQYFLSSTATEKIANFMEKIRQSFAQLLSSDQFKAFLDTFLNKLSDPNFLTGIINKISSFVSLLLKAIAGVVDVADAVGNVFGLGGLLFKSIPNSVPQGIRAIANSLDAQSISSIPSTVSVGSNVAASQIKSNAMTNATAATAKQQGGAPVVVNSPNIVIEDYTTSLTARINRSPERDFSTGIIAA